MNAGELANAERRALNILDKWIEATGAIPSAGSWYWELQGVVEDAVKCGAQAGCGFYLKLESER